MADNTVKQTVELDINGQAARNEMKKLQEEADVWREKMIAASKSGNTKKFNEAHKELTRVNNELRKMQRAQVDVNRVMQNLSSASIKDINRAIKQMNAELTNGSIPRGSAQWKQYKQNLEAARLELAKINAEGKATGNWIDYINNKVSRFGTIAASAIAAITGVSMALSSFRKKGQEKEDAQANTKALTGLDDESIEWLTRQAEKLSTTMEESGLRVKQSASEIMEAFMLVGSNKPELLSDKEALASVTTETLRLSAASGIDLKESVTAVTGALNQFGDGADQAARYVNVLAAGSKYGAAAVGQQAAVVLKAGVSANMAKMSFEQLIGATETLAEFGIKDEIAGTGLKTFLLKLELGAKETRPSVVGLDKALEELSVHTNDAAWMKKAFGLEAFNIAKVLIDNREKVKQYTEAVTDTSVATEQAAITSATASAKMAQLKNEMNEAGIELMKSLDPAIVSITGKIVHWERALVSLIEWCNKHRSTIITATIAITAYTVATNAAVVADKLKVFWTNKVVAGYKALTAAMMKNPWGLVAVAISTAIAYLIDYNKNLKKATATEEAMNRVRQQAGDKAADEAARIEGLRTELKSENVDRTRKLEIIRELSKTIDGYNAKISEEGRLTYENVDAVKAYIKAKEEEYTLDAIQSEMVTAIQQRFSAERELNKQHEEYEKKRQQATDYRKNLEQRVSLMYPYKGQQLAAMAEDARLKDVEREAERARKEVEAAEKKVAEAQSLIDDLNATSAKLLEKRTPTATTPTEDTGGSGDDGDDEKASKKLQKALAALELAAAKEQQAVQEQLNNQEISQEEYATKVYDIEQKLLSDKMRLYKADSKEYMELAKQKVEAATKRGKEAAGSERKAALNGLEQQHKDRKAKAQNEMTEAIQNGKSKAVAQLEYEEKVYQSELTLLSEKMALYSTDSEEYQKLLQEKETATANYMNNLQSAASDFLSTYLGKSDQGGKYDVELQKLEEYHNLGLVSEKQYNDAKDAIQKLSSSNYIKELGAQLSSQKKSYKERVAAIDKAEEEGKITHEDAVAAKKKLDEEYNESLKEGVSTMASSLQSVVSSISSYMQAACDADVAKEEARWDAKIDAAEEAGEDTTELEEQKEAAVAEIKNKYNEKAQKIEIAQAIASGAMAAINAYSSAAAIPYVGYLIAPIAAAAALAATGLQVAAIKKQYEAEAAGYYEGGYTGGSSYRREAGVVHEGEFVANHQAVNNPALRPLLDMIDEAQRTNRIASITEQDIALAAGHASGYYSGGYVAKPARQTATIVTTRSAESEALSSALRQLNERLSDGIQAYTTVDGRGGIDRATKRYNTLKTNKAR
jgi:TP901 family phage tail tape measure protein